MSDLTGRIALVTGGAKGIGQKTAFEFAAAGAHVIVADIDAEGAKRTVATIQETGTAEAITLDVTQPDSWASMATHLTAGVGKLHILVNNAGIILNRPFLQTSFDDFKRVQVVNVDSVWLGTQTCFPLLRDGAKEGSGASIVNISSIYGIVAGPIHAAYSASKGAVRLMTKAVAVEFARMGTGIRVNSIHPGPVNTDLGRSGFQDAVKLGVVKTAEEAKQRVDAQHPMGRMAEVDDIVGGIVFLASDASRFITGAEIVIDGGYTLL